MARLKKRSTRHDTLLNFETFDDFIVQCNKPAHKKCKYNVSKEVSEDRTEFSKSKTYKAALELAGTGWREGAKKIKTGLSELDQPKAPSIQPMFDVSGDEPDIDRFLSNEPENMLDWEQMNKPGIKFIDVFFDCAYSFYRKQDEIIERGVQILSNIDHMEQNGYRCKIVCYAKLTDDKGNTFETYVQLKDYAEVMELDRMAFTMAHPSMLRRLLFRLIEQIPHRKFDCPSYGKLGFIETKPGSININTNMFEKDEIDAVFTDALINQD